MVVNINEKIADRIRKGGFPKRVEEFLKDILIFELEHFEEAAPRYMEKYGDLVRKYTKHDTEEK